MKITASILCLGFLAMLLPERVQADHNQKLLRRIAVSASNRALGQVTTGARAVKTNFNGGWNGSLILIRSTCPVFRNSFGFRHIVSLSGNRVVLRTSHDGTLTGITRDKGKRLEAGRRYLLNGVTVSTAIAYGALNTNAVRMGMSVVLSTGSSVCTASYSGNGVRAF